MDFLEVIKNYVFYAGFEREQFVAAKECFPKSNRKILMVLSFMLGTVVLVMALAAVFWESQGIMVGTLSYLAFSLVNYLMFFIAYRFGLLFPKIILPFCYVILISCYILAIYAGCAHGPTGLAVAIAAMVVVLPIVFYDSPFRLFLLNVTACGVFLILCYNVKHLDVFLADVVDVVPFAIAGCVLGYVSMRTRVNDIVHQSELAKKTAQIDLLNKDLVARNSDLESSLEHERLSSSLIRCLGNSFYSIYYFDLVNNHFKEIKSIESIRKLIGIEGDAKEALKIFCDKMVASENKQTLRNFIDFKSLPERLRGKKSIEEEYLGAFSGWSRALIIPLSLNRDGTASEAVICARSINEEKKAQLRQDNLKKLNESINSGMWNVEFDALGEVESCFQSDVFRRMLGYSPTDEFPTSLDRWNELVHPDDREIVMNSFWTAVRDYTDRIVYDVEFRVQMKNGKYHWYHAAGRVSRRANGNPISMIGVFIDVDNQKEMERLLEQQQATLRDAFVAAQQASSAKSTFLNNMSHDIRTPLNAILGFSNLAETHLDDRAQVKDYLNKISTAGKHLLELVNDVLDMSRIESGKVNIEESPARISSMINEVKAIVNDSAITHHLDLQVDCSRVLDDAVYCDRLRLNQVVINLLSNAIKFSHEGDVVSLEFVQKEPAVDNRASYDIIVKDNGIGMTDEFLKHIFEPFERERTSTVSGIQGTGLGLAICRNIVNLMGGEISVESEVGKGTTFTVSLSFKLADPADVEKDVKQESVPSGSFKGLKVLLVEDNELNAEIAESILKEAGFVVDTVNDGAVAVERIRTAELGQYDVILMDVQMPVMDGYEATRQIRAMHRSGISSLPIIAVTANAFEEDRMLALQAGMDGHVSKPIEISKLMDMLKTVLH